MFAIDIIALVIKIVQSKQGCKLAFHIKILAFNDLCSSSSIDFQTFFTNTAPSDGPSWPF